MTQDYVATDMEVYCRSEARKLSAKFELSKTTVERSAAVAHVYAEGIFTFAKLYWAYLHAQRTAEHVEDVLETMSKDNIFETLYMRIMDNIQKKIARAEHDATATMLSHLQFGTRPLEATEVRALKSAISEDWNVTARRRKFHAHLETLCTYLHDNDTMNDIDDLSTIRFRPKHYDPLPVGYGATRLLVLLPGSPMDLAVQCEMIVSTPGLLGIEQPFEALSWVWGEIDDSSQVLICKDEKTYHKNISPNLFQALKALRFGQRKRYLWVDNICINQEDVQEKNKQVAMMDDIYAKAERVLVWLGESTPSSHEAMAFVNKRILNQDLESLCEETGAAENWYNLYELMQRPWFSRRWVIQEIALAKQAQIHCGSDSIPWMKLSAAISLFVEFETATHRVSDVIKRSAKHSNVPGWFEHVSEMGASILADATGRFFRTAHEEHSDEDDDSDTGDSDHEYWEEEERNQNYRQVIPQQRQSLLDLEYLVSTLTTFEASVTHDSIYALLSLAKDTESMSTTLIDKSGSDASHFSNLFQSFLRKTHFRIDYSQPYVNVCIEFIQFCLRRTTDATRALDVICRPWAAIDKTTESLKRRTRGKPRADTAGTPRGMTLPSWITQISEAPFSMIAQPGFGGSRVCRTNADSLVGAPGTARAPYTAAELRGFDPKTLKFRSRPELGHVSMYVRGFRLDEVEEVLDVSRDGRIPADWADAAGWHGATGPPPDDFWRTLVADREKDGRSPPPYWAIACREAFTKGGYAGGAVNTTDLIRYERNTSLIRFCRRTQSVVWNRALIRTKSGRLGLVKKEVKPGDRVCVLNGCSVPVILRASLERGDAIVAEELRWELSHHATVLQRSWRQHKQRKHEHGKRKEAQMKEFELWNAQQMRKWCKDREWWDNMLRQSPPYTDQALAPTITAYRAHLREIFRVADARISAQFKQWKVDQERLAASQGQRYAASVTDWRKFTLTVKYGRLWMQRMAQKTVDLAHAYTKTLRTQGRLVDAERLDRSIETSPTVLKWLRPLSRSSAARSDESDQVNDREPTHQTEDRLPAQARTHEVQYPAVGGGNLADHTRYADNLKRQPTGPGAYTFRFMGEAYIHGMMDGAAISYQIQHGILDEVFDVR